MMDASALGLFDTLVPIASILTICVLVVYILPKHEHFGLFFLIWWLASVVISLRNDLFAEVGKWSNHHDWIGLVVLVGFPTLILGSLYVWFQTQPKLRIFLYKDVPLWILFGLNVYRLDGLSIILPYWRGNVPKYLGLQMILLDVLIGASSIPLAWIAYSKGADAIAFGWRKDFVWFWNSLGLYDLASAYVVLIMNFFQIGGTMVTDPSLSTVGFHPIPLIVLFQGPLAIAIHVLLLTSMDEIIQRQQKNIGLPLHIQRIRRAQ